MTAIADVPPPLGSSAAALALALCTLLLTRAAQPALELERCLDGAAEPLGASL